MKLKPVTLRFSAACRAESRIPGELTIRSIKEIVQARSYLKVALGLESQQAQHFISDDQARRAVVRHKRVRFG